MSARPRRLGLYVPWGLFFLACLGWTLYWHVFKHEVEKAWAGAGANVSSMGGELKARSYRFSGFPLHLTMTLEDVALRTRGGVRIETSRLPVSVNLVNPRHIIIGVVAPLKVTDAGGRAQTATAESGQMSIRFDRSRTLQRLSLVLKGARVTDGATTTSAGAFALHLRPDPRSARDYQLLVDATDWRGDGPVAGFGALCPCTHVRAGAVFGVTGAARPFTPDWRGPLKLDWFDVATKAGAFTGNGALKLDAARRPEGALSVAAAGAAPVELKAANGWWTIAGARVAPAGPVQVLPD